MRIDFPKLPDSLLGNQLIHAGKAAKLTIHNAQIFYYTQKDFQSLWGYRERLFIISTDIFLLSSRGVPIQSGRRGDLSLIPVRHFASSVQPMLQYVQMDKKIPPRLTETVSG